MDQSDIHLLIMNEHLTFKNVQWWKETADSSVHKLVPIQKKQGWQEAMAVD